MPKANIMIVEDESIVAKDIQQTLKKHGYDTCGPFSRAEDALEKIEETSPDLVLMDIMLKGKKSGIDAAEEIRDKYSIPVVFLTAYADESTLDKAKRAEPYGYILKPFKEIDIKTNIEVALFKHGKDAGRQKELKRFYSLSSGEGDKDALYVKHLSRLVRVPLNTIRYVEAMKDYVVVATEKEKYTIHSTMKNMESKLPATEFIRVHRSFIVRKDKIAAIDMPFLYLDNDSQQIPVGGMYKEELYDKINTI